MQRLFYLLTIFFCWSCTSGSKTEIYQGGRDNITNVKDKVKEIVIDDVMIGGNSQLQLMGDYLIISDYNSYDKLIHFFNLDDFSHVISVGDKGEGPGEITVLGCIGVDEARRKFYVSDHGKQKIFSYDLDSVMANPLYLPGIKMSMSEKQFPSDYIYINDTLCIGRIIEPIGNNDFKPTVGKWNMITGDIKLMRYEHPKIEKKRICFAVSMKDGIYVECYHYHDLMTICNLDGSLKCNIYGPYWDDRKSNKTSYYNKAIFCKDKILVSYSGGDTFSKNQGGGVKTNWPTKFMIFDLNGDYIKTLETGYAISDYCYDAKNDRVIMVLDDENLQFAYLDIDNII